MKNQNKVENEMNIRNNKDLTLLSVFDVGIIQQWSEHTFMRTNVCRSCQCGREKIENTKK